MPLLSYIQALSDGNKLTARITGNAVYSHVQPVLLGMEADALELPGTKVKERWQ
jgi:hypothetical protein